MHNINLFPMTWQVYGADFVGIAETEAGPGLIT